MVTTGISCVVCAYNEAGRIDGILRAVSGHPLLAETIVVDDGSTDGTATRARAWPDVRLISYAENRGKTHALARGIAAARHDYIMLLDADLAGIDADDIRALAEPVLRGRAQVSISLRGNSLGLYRLMGLDFVSGERVAPRSLLREAANAMQSLPRWGAEVYMNELIIAHHLRVAVVDWPDVRNTPKTDKVGAWQGALGELGMVGDTLKVLSPFGMVRQNMGLLRLTRDRTA